MSLSDVVPPKPITWIKNNHEKAGILIMRYMMATLWLSQGLAKVFIRSDNPSADFNKFGFEVNYMAMTNPIPLVVTLLEKIIIPNLTLFVILVISIEITIAISYALGLFTRFGSVVGGLMTINLWILTLGLDEWIWTYPLIFFPHVLLFLARSGRYAGLDRVIAKNTDSSPLTKLG